MEKPTDKLTYELTTIYLILTYYLLNAPYSKTNYLNYDEKLANNYSMYLYLCG